MVMHPRDSEGEQIIRHLRRIGCGVETMWPPPRELPEGVDAVFVLIDERTRRSLAWFGSPPPAAIIVIVSHDTPDMLRLLSDAGPHAVVGKPAEPTAILTNLAVARNLFLRRASPYQNQKAGGDAAFGAQGGAGQAHLDAVEEPEGAGSVRVPSPARDEPGASYRQGCFRRHRRQRSA